MFSTSSHAVTSPLTRRVCGVGLERREVGRQVCGLYLEESLRLAQAAEPMRAQAPEADAGWPRPAPGIPGRGREQELTALSSRAEPPDGAHPPTHAAGRRQRGGPAVGAGSDPCIAT